MSPSLLLGCVVGYFALLLGLAGWTARNADARAYFLGNKSSPWWAVALGLIGDSLSGVSYISVPGKVAVDRWHYLQIVFGYVLGYVLIIHILLPLYYRLNLTSIYGYLGHRFDTTTQRTGAGFFILSRLLGAAVRLYLAVSVFQIFVFEKLSLPGASQPGIPYWMTATVVILLILTYTLKGGIKTLVWTDLFQSGFLVLGIGLSTLVIARALNLDWTGPRSLGAFLMTNPLTEIFDWEFSAPTFFPKQFFAGAALALVMTGLDQNTMQKNLSCRSLREAQWNLYTFSAVMVAVNVTILCLGVLLYEFARQQGIPWPTRSDDLFPDLALHHLGPAAAAVFVIGLTAATFNSADAVLTTLTTSFCLDFLRLDQRKDRPVAAQNRIRRRTHLGFAGLLLVVMLALPVVAGRFPVIDLVLKLSGYTGGPLLALFGLGLFTQCRLGGPLVPLICIGSGTVCGLLEAFPHQLVGGYRFGFELLLLNALLCAGCLLLWARRTSTPTPA